jgi:hypothetical protein
MAYYYINLRIASRTLDPTRSINDNCGWEHICTNMFTFHDYSDDPELQDVCRTECHFRAWGYTTAMGPEDLL